MDLTPAERDLMAHVLDAFEDGYGSEALIGALRPWNIMGPPVKLPDWVACPSLWDAFCRRWPHAVL